MKSTPAPHASRHEDRRTSGRAQDDHILDPYQRQQKLHEPTVCRRCGAIYRNARWQWGEKPADAHEEPCPACRRIEEELPAGIVTVHGPLTPTRKDEIIGLARHQEQAENREHPLNRIIAIDEKEDGLSITTTDIHLPRRLGEALKRALHGDLAMHFDQDNYFVRVDLRPLR